MLWREKEFFRFHLRLIFVLVFAALLCQSEDHQEASQVTESESCANAASAWMKKDIFEEVVKVNKFTSVFYAFILLFMLNSVMALLKWLWKYN